MRRVVSSDDCSIHLDLAISDELESRFEQFERSITLRASILGSPTGLSLWKSVLCMAADWEITDNGSIHGIIEVKVDVGHMQKLCLPLIHLQSRTLHRQTGKMRQAAV